MRLGYTYKGLYKDCKNIIEFCHICSQKKKEYYKREPTKQLIFTHPNERLLADLTELPFELKENNKYKFLLNIILIFPNIVGLIYWKIKNMKLYFII